MPQVNMPRLSDTMQEGTIVRWLKQHGETIKKGDILAEIETDKATMELEAYDTGILENILVQAGETVPTGQAVAVIGTVAGEHQESESILARQDKQGAGIQERVQPIPTATTTGSDMVESSNGRLIKASPLARRLAEEHHLDLRQIRGTGPSGRIVRDDIVDVLEQPSAPSTAVALPAVPSVAPPQDVPARIKQERIPPDGEIIPLSRVQMLIAQRLVEAKQTIPHFYVSNEVDMTDVLGMRQLLNAHASAERMKVSINDMIVKACALALEAFPEVNTSFQNGQVVQHHAINIGIAVDVPAGLAVPVIRQTNIKGIRSIAQESKTLIEKARSNKLAPVDLEGGTFSVSNLGMLDVTDFVAVINPPQAAILAVASTRKQFVPINGEPVICDLMTMTVSADHRILYGASVARFLQEIKRLLQNPYSLLG
ncbi:MAG: 2-oxo acid dehydrogenase subunit E2 [Ktedonobacteraceae bacterium]|nr:2-oxo acid dehydrogenase subunit E2 [Ktedonobacteraceae bacterium]